jgi:hypothetical protein
MVGFVIRRLQDDIFEIEETESSPLVVLSIWPIQVPIWGPAKLTGLTTTFSRIRS